MSWVRFYWTGGMNTIAKLGSNTYCWDGIYGIQIKSVFIGIIIGDGDDQ